MQTRPITTQHVVRALIGRTTSYRMLIVEHEGREYRYALDLQHLTPTGWESMPERDVRDWCADCDLPVLGLDRDDLVRQLAERHGVEHPDEILDYEMPEYRMTSDDVDSFAEMLGE